MDCSSKLLLETTTMLSHPCSTWKASTSGRLGTSSRERAKRMRSSHTLSLSKSSRPSEAEAWLVWMDKMYSMGMGRLPMLYNHGINHVEHAVVHNVRAEIMSNWIVIKIYFLRFKHSRSTTICLCVVRRYRSLADWLSLASQEYWQVLLLFSAFEVAESLEFRFANLRTTLEQTTRLRILILTLHRYISENQKLWARSDRRPLECHHMPEIHAEAYLEFRKWSATPGLNRTAKGSASMRSGLISP